jgi:hypothetical protein
MKKETAGIPWTNRAARLRVSGNMPARRKACPL